MRFKGQNYLFWELGHVKNLDLMMYFVDMKKLLSLVTTLLIALPALAQDFSLFEKQLFVKDEDTLRCRILTPLNFKPEKKYPLLVFLHGAGERGADNEKQLTWGGTLFSDSANRVNFPAIVVFPQCPANSFWAPLERVLPVDSLGTYRIHSDSPATKPMRMVMDFIDTLLAAGNVDPNRVYIGGLSMGAMGTFDILARRPDRFAAAFPICGAGDPKAVANYRKGLPIWVFHGGADPIVLPGNSRLMVSTMRKTNKNVRYTEYPGVGHDSWKNAFSEKDLLPWLFAQKKK
jgi:predicted peptidase